MYVPTTQHVRSHYEVPYISNWGMHGNVYGLD